MTTALWLILVWGLVGSILELLTLHFEHQAGRPALRLALSVILATWAASLLFH